MRKPFLLISIIFLSGAMLAPVGVAQERPKVGVALSGGAAKGIAHVGVLKVLEEVGMPVDYVTGVSMGSIIGGLYAAGYTTAELEALVNAVDWDEVFADRIPRRRLDMEHKRWDSRYLLSLPIEQRKIRLPSGLIAGHNLTRLFARLTVPLQHSSDFTEFPIPFSCVAADIVTGEAVVLDHGLLYEAMRASMAIPTAFTPVRIGDHLLVDGGLARVLPAVDARNLGADIVIGVDVGERPQGEDKLNTIIDMTRQSLTLLMAPADDRQRELCDILISPDVHDIPLHDFGEGQRFIEKGEEAARAILPRLQQLADSLRELAAPAPRPTPRRTDSFYIAEVSIEGLDKVPRVIVEREFHFDAPGRMSVAEIEEGIDRVYNTRFFEYVSYRIETADGGARLTLKVAEKQENLFRIGLRYDSRRDVGFLLNTTFQHVLTHGATVTFDAILAREYEFDARFFMHLGPLRALGVRARSDLWNKLFDVFEGEQRVAEYRATYSFGELLLGSVFSPELCVAVGFRGEYLDYKLEVGPPQSSTLNNTFVPVFGKISLDTYDRTVFPTRGLFVDLVAEAADDNLGSDVSFSRYYLDQRAIVSLHRKVSLLQGLYLGTTSSDNLPIAYEFYLGGVDETITLLGERTSFFGLKYQERVGPHVQMFQMGLQVEFLHDAFIQAAWNIGNTFDEFSFDLNKNRYINGGGITIGMNSILGPVKLTAATSELNNFLAYFSAGYWF